MENIGGRELEKFIQENISARWFCGFSLTEQKPDFILFSKI